MKNYPSVFLFLCGLLTACSGGQSVVSDLISIDVAKDYPKNEIRLSDIADLSYAQLSDDNPDYIFSGFPLAFTPNNIIVHNPSTGDILFFDKQGKPKNKINRRGNGPGEYQMIGGAVYNEQSDELITYFRNQAHIYSSNGTYKRSLSLPPKAWISEVALCDDNTLIVYDQSRKATMMVNRLNEIAGKQDGDAPSMEEEGSLPTSFARISYDDGRLIDSIAIPEDPTIMLSVAFEHGEIKGMMPGKTNRITRYRDGVLLRNQETDTLFYYNPKAKQIMPFYVQQPTVSALTPKVYLNNIVGMGRYDFIEIFKLELLRPGELTGRYLARDTKSGEVFEPTIVFDEMKEKELQISPAMLMKTGDSARGFIELKYEELQQAKESNRLSGELKRVADAMGDNENSIYLFFQFK